MRPRHALLAVGLALVGCGDPDRVAGGSSYETENAVAARFLAPDGTPAVGALVRARPLEWVDGGAGELPADLRTDGDGRCTLRLDPGAWRLEARLAGSVAVGEVPAIRRGLDLGSVRLTRPGSVFGRALPGSRVGVSGLQHQAVVNSEGYFQFDSLPPGVHVLRQVGSQARAFAFAEAGISRDAGLLRTEIPGQILLDDFEDGDTRLRHGAWTGGGWWWVDADSGVNLSPDGVSDKPERAILADGEGGKVLHVSAAFPDGAPSTSWAQTGHDFVGTRPLDLSGLASIRFRARGIGTIAVLVHLEEATPAQVPRAEVVLDSVWREFEIPAARLQPPAWSGVVLDSATRSERLRSAVGLSWSMSSSGDLWLDDVRLVGPSSALLWGANPPP
jgi:hypothetical protein